ncbi:hypothetical protein Tco_0252595 [Tanacetum coccineum]
MTFDETPSPSKTSPLVDDDLDEEEAIKVTEKKNLEKDIEDETLEIDKIDHVLACLYYMLYYVPISEKFNLAFYMAKRMEWVTKQSMLILPYGMLLTRLFKFVTSESPELLNESYVLYDRVMNPLTAQQERKTRKDYGTRRGRHSTSFSSAFDQPSSSHLNDDDDDDSRASIPSPIRYVNSLTNKVPQVFQNPQNIDPDMEPFYTRQTEIINHQVQLQDEHRASSSHGFKKIKLTIIPPKQLFVYLTNDDENLTTPSPITTFSSPTPPNAPLKTPSTNETSSGQDNTPSSFKSKLQILPPSSNEPNSPQPLNPLFENILDVPLRPSNPQPLQSHLSLDITLSLSPFENLETLSPPSPPQPQLPIIGHPLYYNYHDYHGSTCICCSHNRTLFLTLRDKMNNMFAHLEYLLTTAITSHFPPLP